MAARRRNFQGALRTGLAFDVGQVGPARRKRGGAGVQPGPAFVTIGRVLLVCAGQKLAHHIQQVRGTVDARTRHQRGFFRAARWQHQSAAHPGGVQCQAHGQSAAHRAQRAAQGQFAGELIGRQTRPIDLAAGRQNAQGNG